MSFEKESAGIVPTHGGFLMCGRLLASSDPTLKKGVFTVRKFFVYPYLRKTDILLFILT